VLALVPYPLGLAPGQRYRIEQWAPYLRESGIDVQFECFADLELASSLYQPGRLIKKGWLMSRAWLARIGPVLRSAQYDALFLYREAALIGPALLERLARARNPRIVYDFDDAIWLRYVSPSNRHLSYLKWPWKTRTLCKLAAAVTVGNEHLAEYARRYNHDVRVVPSTVSLREYGPVERRATPPEPVVGWTGSHSSIQYLEIVKGALQTLARRRRFRLRVVGVEQYSIPGVEVECTRWRAESEVEDLSQIDVGIMPLTDDPWTAGKCAMKAIQYLGLGIPAVVSPVGANCEVVEDGVAGFHARTESDWITTLERCLADGELRARMGNAGRARVAALYSAERQAPRLADILLGLRL